MNFSHSTKGKASGIAAIALTALLSTGAMAQGFGGNASGDQDSLLPPEVVPLDPSAVSPAAMQQANSMNVGNASLANNGQAVPGLVGTNGANGMQSAKDFRQAAFNSLYGQGQLPSQDPMLQASGGVSQNQMLGQNPMMNGSGSGPYGTPVQAASLPSQSQRLSGAPKNPPKIRDTRRGGFSNGLSAAAGFGSGVLLSGALMHPANPMMGLGMYGLTMTGFGVRNAFRF